MAGGPETAGAALRVTELGDFDDGDLDAWADDHLRDLHPRARR